MIVNYVTDYGISVYDANSDGRNGIRADASYSWEEFYNWRPYGVSLYKYIYYDDTPSAARIDINPNGGTAQNSFHVNYGEKCNLTIDSAWRAGYKLSGWNLYRPADGKWFVGGIGWCTSSEISANGYEKCLYAPNLSMTLDSSWYNNCSTTISSFTFYAVWEDATYTININANGGTAITSSLSLKYNQICNLSPDYVQRDGYELAGWNLFRPADAKWFVGGKGWFTEAEISANGYEKQKYVPNLSMTLDSSWFGKCSTSVSMFTFLAVWAEKYTVTFDPNGGTVSPMSKTVTNGSTYGSLPTPTRTGYIFDGWYNYLYNGGVFENGKVEGNYLALGRDYMYTDQIAVHVEAYQSDWSSFDGQLISCTEGGGWGMGYFADSNGNGPGVDAYIDGVGYKGVAFDYRSLSSGWHSFDLVFDGSNLIGYVDGVEKGRVATGGTTIRYNAANGIFIGAEAGLDEVTPISNYFTGTIGCVIISHSDTMCGAITSDSIVSITDNHTLYAQWIANTPVVNPAAGSGTVVDESTHFIYGLSAGAAQGCVAVTDGTAAYEYANATQVLGTGTKVNVYNNDNALVDSYTIVVFGDVDGDGWYDGTDAYYVSLLANGLIPQTALTAAQRAACDANHDGAIDEADVSIIEQAGLLLAQVDQTAPIEELQANSVYLEYCGLIDQNIEITEPDQQTAVDEPQPTTQTVWGWLKALFTVILNWLLRAF